MNMPFVVDARVSSRPAAHLWATKPYDPEGKLRSAQDVAAMLWLGFLGAVMIGIGSVVLDVW